METIYKEFHMDDNVAALSSTVDSRQSKRKVNYENEDDFNIRAYRFGWKEATRDELERYLKAPPLDMLDDNEDFSFDLIEWWRANERVYPTLVRIAYELYSIPSMSAEVERVFSK
jgi:hAT family C-terminal dimerisation region